MGSASALAPAASAGVECKRMDAPKLTPSMRTAMQDLNLDRLIVLYPGPHPYPLAERIGVMPLSDMLDRQMVAQSATIRVPNPPMNFLITGAARKSLARRMDLLYSIAG
jgi:hypothetical protein